MKDLLFCWWQRSKSELVGRREIKRWRDREPSISKSSDIQPSRLKKHIKFLIVLFVARTSAMVLRLGCEPPNCVSDELPRCTQWCPMAWLLVAYIIIIKKRGPSSIWWGMLEFWREKKSNVWVMAYEYAYACYARVFNSTSRKGSLSKTKNKRKLWLECHFPAFVFCLL